MIGRLLLALPLAAFGALWLWFLTAPWPLTLPFRDPSNTAFMRMRVSEARADGVDLTIDYRPVPLDQIAPAMRRAVIVSEDGRFREHDGVDWRALAEEVEWTGRNEFRVLNPSDWKALFDAFRYYRANSEKIRGRSTITQQLAKNLYFSTDRSLSRKLDELLVAKRLEWFLSKDRILELYLNTAELGPGIFGVEAAAQHYFGVSAADLSRYQAASLAGTLPHPLSSNPAHRPGRMGWRRDRIMARMGGTGAVETVPLAPEAVEVSEPPVLGRPAPEAQPEPLPDTVIDSVTEPVEPVADPPADTTADRP